MDQKLKESRNVRCFKRQNTEMEAFVRRKSKRKLSAPLVKKRILKSLKGETREDFKFRSHLIINQSELIILEKNVVNGSGADFSLLPEVVLMKIFEYLPIRDRCRAGLACRRWYSLTKSYIFWEKVKVQDMTSNAFLKIIPNLLSCTAHLFLSSKSIVLPLNLAEIMVQLHDSCPSLQTFILDAEFPRKNLQAIHYRFRGRETGQNIKIEYFKPDIQKCNLILPQLKVLSLMSSAAIMCFIELVSAVTLPNLRVLNLNTRWKSRLYYIHPSSFTFSLFTNLEELYLANAFICDDEVAHLLKCMKNLKVLDLERSRISSFNDFMDVIKYGQSLEKLFLGHTAIGFNVTEEVILPQLQTLCVRYTKVTPWSIKKLLKLCPALTCVNVTEHEVSKKWLQDCLPKYMQGKLKYPEGVPDNMGVCFHFYMENISPVFEN